MVLAKLGRKAHLGIRAAGVTGGSGNWLTVGSAVDVTLGLNKEVADATARDSQGWKQEVPVLTVASVQFSQIWRETDPARDVIRAAFLSEALIGVRVLDAEHGEGLEANMQVRDFTQSQPVAGLITCNIVLAPSEGSNARWLTTAGATSLAPSGVSEGVPAGGPWTDFAAALAEGGDAAEASQAEATVTKPLVFAMPAQPSTRTRVFVRIKCYMDPAGIDDEGQIAVTSPLGTIASFSPPAALAWVEREITSKVGGWEALLAAGTNVTLVGTGGVGGTDFYIDAVTYRFE